MKRSLLVASVLLLAAPSAFAGSLPFASAKTSKGEVLTDTKGMTLYIYDKDTRGTSTMAKSSGRSTACRSTTGRMTRQRDRRLAMASTGYGTSFRAPKAALDRHRPRD
jgi:hypothetical protein